MTTAHQLGVVGYRDPVGAISPDGSRIAFAEGRRLFSEQIRGGARIELAAAEGQIRHLTWLGAAVIFEDVSNPVRWWIVKPGASAQPFGDKATSDLRQMSGFADGTAVAAIANGQSGSELRRLSSDGAQVSVTAIAGRASFPAWTWGGEIACVIATDGRPRLVDSVRPTASRDETGSRRDRAACVLARRSHGVLRVAEHGRHRRSVERRSHGRRRAQAHRAGARHLRAVDVARRDGAVQDADVSDDGRRARSRGRQPARAHGVSGGDAKLLRGRHAHRGDVRHLAARDRRCEVSRHRAGHRPHRGR